MKRCVPKNTKTNVGCMMDLEINYTKQYRHFNTKAKIVDLNLSGLFTCLHQTDPDMITLCVCV